MPSNFQKPFPSSAEEEVPPLGTITAYVNQPAVFHYHISERSVFFISPYINEFHVAEVAHNVLRILVEAARHHVSVGSNDGRGPHPCAAPDG
jgi:hypothetical protein